MSIKLELSEDEFIGLIFTLDSYMTAIAHNPTSKEILNKASKDPSGKLAIKHFKTMADLTARLKAMIE